MAFRYRRVFKAIVTNEKNQSHRGLFYLYGEGDVQNSTPFPDALAMSSHLFQQNGYPTQPYSSEPLAFFGGPSTSSATPYYAGSRSSLEGNMGGSKSSSSYATGNMTPGGRIGGMMSGEGRWWEAFGTGGFEGEPSLMEGGSEPPLPLK